MMSESVTVTVQNGNEANRGSAGQPPVFSLNADYFRTIPGLIKLVQIVLGIICIALGSGHGAGGWFTFVAVTAFIISVIWSMIYLFSVREALRLPINWLLTEMLNTAIYAVFYLTAFIVQIAYSYGYAAYIAAGVFGFFNTLAYAAGTYYLYLEHIGSSQR